MDTMFGKESFTTEIETKADARAGVRYLSQNETQFRRELEEQGHTYEEEEEMVRMVWKNLLDSCKRVGFSDFTTKHKMKQYKMTK